MMKRSVMVQADLWAAAVVAGEVLADFLAAEDRTLKIYSAAEICQTFSGDFSAVADAVHVKVLT
jgi:hypothetical protein